MVRYDLYLARSSDIFPEITLKKKLTEYPESFAKGRNTAAEKPRFFWEKRKSGSLFSTVHIRIPAKENVTSLNRSFTI